MLLFLQCALNPSFHHSNRWRAIFLNGNGLKYWTIWFDPYSTWVLFIFTRVATTSSTHSAWNAKWREFVCSFWQLFFFDTKQHVYGEVINFSDGKAMRLLWYSTWQCIRSNRAYLLRYAYRSGEFTLCASLLACNFEIVKIVVSQMNGAVCKDAFDFWWNTVVTNKDLYSKQSEVVEKVDDQPVEKKVLPDNKVSV